MSDKLASYGLEGNTFLEERHDFPMVGRTKEWEQIVDVLEDLLNANSCGIMVIHGDYGMGKTFTLLKLEEDLKNSKIKSSSEKTLPVLLKSTPSQLPSNYLTDLIVRINRKIGKETLTEIACNFNVKESEVNVDDTIHNTFRSLAYNNSEAWDWMIGRTVSSTAAKDIGISYKIDDKNEIENTFTDYLKILKSADYNNLVILLDEMEYLLASASAGKIRSVVNELQHVWDSYNEVPEEVRKTMCKVIFLIGTSVDAWQKFLEMVEIDTSKKGGGGTETFLRRIPEQGKITLEPLRDKDVKKFLSNRLKVYKKKETSDALYPFDESYVKFISEMSWGIPSNILSLSALIINEAVKKGIKTINKEVGQEILKEHGLLLELQEAGPGNV